MPYFRCQNCNSVYEDYYPPDDSCLKCKRGLVRIIEEPVIDASSITHHKEEDQ